MPLHWREKNPVNVTENDGTMTAMARKHDERSAPLATIPAELVDVASMANVHSDGLEWLGVRPVLG